MPGIQDPVMQEARISSNVTMASDKSVTSSTK